MDIKTNKSVRPRPATATSIPGMLTLLQSEWDPCFHALHFRRMLQARGVGFLWPVGISTQEQLSHSTPLPGGAVREDAETGLTPEILQKMKELADTLSKTRKRKDFPDLNPLAQLKKFTCARHSVH
eukprot:s9711_g1.t1